MSGLAHHLVRRGLDVTHRTVDEAVRKSAEDGKPIQLKSIPAWAIAMLWATLLAFIFVQVVINYTYGSVVATLTTIETPTATAFTVASVESGEADAPLLAEDQKSADKAPSTEPELFLVKTKPITSKIRTTINHLKAQAGPWSRFRGLQVAIVYHIAYALLFNLFSSFTRAAALQGLFGVLIHVVLARVNMTWTHIVMSNPSPKRWWRRYPSLKAGSKILLPTAIWATAGQLALYIPTLIFGTYGLHRYTEDPSHYRQVAPKAFTGDIGTAFIVILVTLFIVFAIVIPAEVSLTRVQASMLPYEDETIVPFDRSFGGKVEPEVAGGISCVSMLDAWKTFDWAARIRLVKLYVKVFALQIVTTFMFIGLLVGELKLAMGDDFNKVGKMVHEQLRR